MIEAQTKKSDLGVRTMSAIVMVAVAGTALWLGGLIWSLFAVAIMLGVLWEWRTLAAGITPSHAKRGLWNAAGIAYVGFATWMLVVARGHGLADVLLIVAMVIATDVGAYFAGRTIGGPKIAPKISPSKTWAGLIGGVIACSLVVVAYSAWANAISAEGLRQLQLEGEHLRYAPLFRDSLLIGGCVAVVAQAGDFFESWMKRRAGVKDSSHLIPGHGGLFDRLDGLLAVSFVYGILLLLSGGLQAIS